MAVYYPANSIGFRKYRGNIAAAAESEKLLYISDKVVDGNLRKIEYISRFTAAAGNRANPTISLYIQQFYYLYNNCTICTT